MYISNALRSVGLTVEVQGSMSILSAHCHLCRHTNILFSSYLIFKIAGSAILVWSAFSFKYISDFRHLDACMHLQSLYVVSRQMSDRKMGGHFVDIEPWG